MFALLNEMNHAAAGGSSSCEGDEGHIDSRSSKRIITAPKTNYHGVSTPSATNATSVHLGCNPHVEIIRHRQHEKFKAGFYDLFRAQCSSTYNNNGGNNTTTDIRNDKQQQHIIRSTISTIWKSIPPHTIWERFQFSLKTLEAECVRELTTVFGNSDGEIMKNSITSSSTTSMQQQQQLQHLAFPSVHQLHSHIMYSRSRGTYWEPLLPVPTIITTTCSDNGGEYDNELNGRKMNERYRHETHQLLRGEIEFQFRRVFKKVVGTKKGGTVPTLFLQLGGVDDRKANKKKSKKKTKGPSDKNNDDTHNISNPNYEQVDEDDDDKEEEYILRTIFASQPFQKITLKLHKKILQLAKDNYSSFLVETQKCSNRLLEEDRKQMSCVIRGGGSRKKKKQKHDDHHDMPKITRVENSQDNNDDVSNNLTGADMDRQVAVTFMGISLRINDWHRDKLFSLYQRTLSNLLRLNCVDYHVDEMEIQQQQYHHLLQQFPKLLFSLLLRYDALEGAGLQSAIPPTVFRYLHIRFGCGFECFASPFNCNWLEKDDIGSACNGRYGSAYGDTDAMFGSFGSFFDIDFLNLSPGGESARGGCYQANPPFASEFIEKMYHRMHHFLESSEQNRERNEEAKDDGGGMGTIPLMFVIFVPAWSKCSGWKLLSSSTYLSKHIQLSQKDDVHYYAEGTQHRRKRHRTSRSNLTQRDNDSGKEGHRVASFDTSVFFLQNDAAKAKWPIIGEDEVLLKNAFAMIVTKDDDDEDYKKSRKRVQVEQPFTTATPHRSNDTSHGTTSARNHSSSATTTKAVSWIAKKGTKGKMNMDIKIDKNAEWKQVCSRGVGGTDTATTTTTTTTATISKKHKKQKRALMTGGQDELRILASMGILD